MGGGGGKGRETTQTVELPPSLEQGANEVLAAGMRSAALPYSPNRGVTIAAFTPQQNAAIRASNMMASAMGLPTVGSSYGMATGSQFDPSTGILGFSTGDLYDANVAASMTPEELAQREELRLSYGNAAGRIYEAAGINPADAGVYGSSADGGTTASSMEGDLPQWYVDEMKNREDKARGGGGIAKGGGRRNSSGGGLFGYSSFGDMFDGGGPGASGGRFEGGGIISDIANTVTGNGRTR